MKKIILSVILTLSLLIGYSQYSSNRTVGGTNFYTRYDGAFKHTGPLMLASIDTLHSLVGNSKYLGAMVFKTSDSCTYQMTGLQWEKIYRTIYFEAPLSITNGVVSINQDLLEVSNLLKMTKSDRNLIPSPTEGMMIYQIDNTPGLRVYNGTHWVRYSETDDD